MIANARHYGGGFVLAPRTGILERGLEAILFKTRSRAVLFGQLMSLATGRLEPRAAHGGDVEMLACSRVTVAPHIPCRSRSTATPSARRPSRWTRAPREVRLIVPPASGGSSRNAGR